MIYDNTKLLIREELLHLASQSFVTSTTVSAMLAYCLDIKYSGEWKELLEMAKGLMAEYALNIEESIDMMMRKNQMYGSKPLILSGVSGVRVRVIDKLCRIENMLIAYNDTQQLMLFESLKDNVMDVFNYTLIALMLLEKCYLKFDVLPDNS